MLIIENVPPHVATVAIACALYDTTVQEVLRGPPESNELFAAEAGLTFAEYLNAIDWLQRFWKKQSCRELRLN
jgi:hypothetical protein